MAVPTTRKAARKVGRCSSLVGSSAGYSAIPWSGMSASPASSRDRNLRGGVAHSLVTATRIPKYPLVTLREQNHRIGIVWRILLRELARKGRRRSDVQDR